jgi:hypothetical protein
MDREERIRAHAQRIWEEEGRPEGRAQEHWDMATELVAIEDNQNLATKPNPLTHPDNRGEFGEPVEPAAAAGSLGDLPHLTDQGDRAEMPTPRRRAPSAGAKTPVPKKPGAAKKKSPPKSAKS